MQQCCKKYPWVTCHSLQLLWLEWIMVFRSRSVRGGGQGCLLDMGWGSCRHSLHEPGHSEKSRTWDTAPAWAFHPLALCVCKVPMRLSTPHAPRWAGRMGLLSWGSAPSTGPGIGTGNGQSACRFGKGGTQWWCTLSDQPAEPQTHTDLSS